MKKSFKIFILQTGKLLFAIIVFIICLGFYPLSYFSPKAAALFSMEISYAHNNGLILVCGAVYFIVFLILSAYNKRVSFYQLIRKNAWLFWMCIFVCISIFAKHIFAPDYTLEAILLGVALGKGFCVWAAWSIPFFTEKSSTKITLFLLVALFTIFSFPTLGIPFKIEYRGDIRWTGVWGDPDVYGLLMGSGFVLSVGLLLYYLILESDREVVQVPMQYRKLRTRITIIVFLLAVSITGYSMLHSYSRGAWLGAMFGLIYLAYNTFTTILSLRLSCRPVQDKLHLTFFPYSLCLEFRKNFLWLATILISLFILIFWCARYTDRTFAGRIISMSDSKDFSWRNRLATWEEALQVMAEHPWVGTPQKMYDQFYQPPTLYNNSAIQTNDYLMIGATLGLPTLFSFAAYIWLSVTRKQAASKSTYINSVCRASSVVLLIGFWFDGGLLLLATASTFWILLELGNLDNLNSEASNGIAYTSL